MIHIKKPHLLNTFRKAHSRKEIHLKDILVLVPKENVPYKKKKSLNAIGISHNLQIF